MTESQRSAETKQRLLEAASEVFVDQGFRGARVRDICQLAGANVAAVNYHFGDKKGLYEAVLRYAFFSLTGEDPTEWVGAEDGGPESGIHALVRSLLSQLLRGGESTRYAKLVAREMVDPTDAIDQVINDGIRPQVKALMKILRMLYGKRVSEQRLRRCASSILGQCLFYYFGRPAILQTGLEKKLGPRSVDVLARHITEFSLAAMRGLSKTSK